MTQPSHNSSPDRDIYPAPHFEGFDPYTNESDKWLYEESRNDSRLLFMLLAKEEYQGRLASREEPIPDKEIIESVERHIRRRKAELDLDSNFDG